MRLKLTSHHFLMNFCKSFNLHCFSMIDAFAVQVDNMDDNVCGVKRISFQILFRPTVSSTIILTSSHCWVVTWLAHRDRGKDRKHLKSIVANHPLSHCTNAFRWMGVLSHIGTVGQPACMPSERHQIFHSSLRWILISVQSSPVQCFCTVRTRDYFFSTILYCTVL